MLSSSIFGHFVDVCLEAVDEVQQGNNGGAQETGVDPLMKVFRQKTHILWDKFCMVFELIHKTGVDPLMKFFHQKTSCWDQFNLVFE